MVTQMAAAAYRKRMEKEERLGQEQSAAWCPCLQPCHEGKQFRNVSREVMT